jgi:hypothetical protein
MQEKVRNVSAVQYPRRSDRMVKLRQAGDIMIGIILFVSFGMVLGARNYLVNIGISICFFYILLKILYECIFPGTKRDGWTTKKQIQKYVSMALLIILIIGFHYKEQHPHAFENNPGECLT